jgi:ribosomal protein S18 acetylase RimI-like enzyme
VCRIDDDVIWAESLYVKTEHRREGIASLLYREAEKIAEELGSDTVYNWVHPNNDRIINFLRKNGYDVLNLIEVRRPRKGEQTHKKIKVDKHEFNY